MLIRPSLMIGKVIESVAKTDTEVTVNFEGGYSAVHHKDLSAEVKASLDYISATLNAHITAAAVTAHATQTSGSSGGTGGGGTGGTISGLFWENPQIITSDYTVPAGKNAMIVGPITIADGVSVTVPDGANLVVL